MRSSIIIAVTTLGVACGALALTASPTEAQGAPLAPPPPMAQPTDQPMDHGGMPPDRMQGGMMHGGMMHGGMMHGGMMHGGMMQGGMMQGGPMEARMHGGWMRRMHEFALIYPAQDRNLSGADVQKIAEAFLLFNGNHSWKITNVTEEPNRVTFAIATPDGTAIAHFAMDRHSARPERID